MSEIVVTVPEDAPEAALERRRLAFPAARVEAMAAADTPDAGVAGREEAIAGAVAAAPALGQPGHLAAQDGRHGRDERALRHPVQMQKAEERPQCGDRQLRHAGVLAGAPRHHEGGDIGRGQTPEIELPRRHPAVQERAQAIDVPTGRHCRQIAFRDQELLVPVQDYLGGVVLHRGFGHGHQPQPAQMVENGTQCLARLQFAHASGTAVSHEPINLRYRQVAHRELLPLQPAAQFVEQLAMLPDGASCVDGSVCAILGPLRLGHRDLQAEWRRALRLAEGSPGGHRHRPPQSGHRRAPPVELRQGCRQSRSLERCPISLHRSLRRRSSWRIPGA